MLFLFSWLDTERQSRRAVITSLVSMRSVCAVSHSVISCVLRVLRSPEHTITTNALYVSDSAGNVSSNNPKEKSLGLEQRSGATDFRSKGHRVSTCSFQETFVTGLDHCRVLIIHRGIIINIKHVLPAPLLETSTFSGVSLKTLLVLSHRLYLPSKSCAPA